MQITEQTRGGVLVIQASGRLDSNTAGALEAVLPARIQANDKVVVSLADVPYVSSAGLRVLLIGAKAARAGGKKLALVGLSESVAEVFDATIVQPIKVVSTVGLWRGFDVKVVDGAVNGAGYLVSGVSIVLRLLQNGSVKTYAASIFVGAVTVLAYYLWR